MVESEEELIKNHLKNYVGNDFNYDTIEAVVSQIIKNKIITNTETTYVMNIVKKYVGYSKKNQTYYFDLKKRSKPNSDKIVKKQN